MTGDNPIESRTEDRLGRARFADEIASALRGMDPSRGVVVGLMAPWGYGKTSVLNMVTEQLDVEPALTVLQFNPWMISGSDQLVRLFFEQVAAQLRLRGGKADSRLADRLIEYGQAVGPLQFIPVAGVWMSRAGALAASTGKLMKGRKKPESIAAQRQAIEQALRDLPSPLVAVLDDIDRLTPPEIRDIFRLVRLTAHFPNVIYLLAFDRARVERALDNDADTGRAYLEKIIEVDFDLPAIPEASIVEILLTELATAIGEQDTGPFDEYLWPDVVAQVMRPLFRTLRDVNRYLATLPATLATIGAEVALVDTLALEAARQRLPRLFTQLPALRDLLTNVGMRPSTSADDQAQIEQLLTEAGADRDATAGLLRLLFPATERYLGGSHYGADWLGTWQRGRRVAHPDVFDFYLSRVLPATSVDSVTVNQVLANLDNATELRAIVDRLDGPRTEHLLVRLEAHASDIDEASVEPACSVFLDQYAKISRDALGMHDFGPELAIDRLVVRLLRRIESEDDRAQVVHSIDSVLASFTGRFHLLTITGSSSQTQPLLLAAATRDRLRQVICGQARHAGAGALARESDPLSILANALAENPADRADIDAALEDVDLASAVLRSAVTEVRSQTIGSVAIRREPVLRWETLLTVVGGSKDALRPLIDTVEPGTADDQALATAVTLARRYLQEGPPPQWSMPRRPLVRRVPNNSPHSTFTPSAIGSVSPALVLRAVTTYEVDPAWDQSADIAAREVLDTLARLLAGLELPELLASTAREQGIQVFCGNWEADPAAVQSSRAAVARLRLTDAEHEQIAVVRYGIFLSDQRGPARLIVDVLISETAAQDEEWFPLSLGSAARLLEAALACLSESITDPLLAQIFNGEVPSRSSTELHLESLQTGDNQRSVRTLAATLDLASLGAPSRPDQPPNQGMFAVSGDAPLATQSDRFELLRTAIERMACDWGYIDVQPGMPQIFA